MASIFVKVGEREVPLRFDTQAWLDVEEAFGSIGGMQLATGGTDKPISAGIKLIEIVSAAGARKHGGRALTKQELMRKLSPKEIISAIGDAKNAVSLGLRREHADDEDEEIDAVLAKLNKEKEKNAESCSTDEP